MSQGIHLQGSRTPRGSQNSSLQEVASVLIMVEVVTLVNPSVSANKDFTDWYTNADSLINKVHELKLLIASCSNRPDIIAVTEVKPKLKYTIQTSELNLDGNLQPFP